MIEVKQMDHLNMGVRNIAETEKFYQDLFGFEVKERGSGRTEMRMRSSAPPTGSTCASTNKATSRARKTTSSSTTSGFTSTISTRP